MQPIRGAIGVDLLVMSSAEKRRGGSKATTSPRPQQVKTNNPKAVRGGTNPRPQTR
jgi:hypothetical protein